MVIEKRRGADAKLHSSGLFEGERRGCYHEGRLWCMAITVCMGTLDRWRGRDIPLRLRWVHTTLSPAGDSEVPSFVATQHGASLFFAGDWTISTFGNTRVLR
ncbi:hypothetical protein RM96_07955 [Cupriavidus sp. IDO]|nr:hypothetical protein RM96_07955 [Cupriavidus sp. IDO]